MEVLMKDCECLPARWSKEASAVFNSISGLCERLGHLANSFLQRQRALPPSIVHNSLILNNVHFSRTRVKPQARLVSEPLASSSRSSRYRAQISSLAKGPLFSDLSVADLLFATMCPVVLWHLSQT